MPKKIQNTTKANLISVALPTHGATYTVISHQFVIDYAYQALANAGFGIVDEEYRCTSDGQIAQGIYKLNFNNDPELSMMFAWTNSYNKQVKFKCVVGAYINNTGAVMISGEVGSWVRKHTGTADTETKDTIDNYIANANMYYTQLCSDKAAMEVVTLNRRKQSQLLGVLFAEYEILTTEQASMVRDQMKKPYHVFTNTDSLWAFYNYVTNSLQFSHPKTWMEDQRILHYFISTIGNFQQCSTPAQVVQPINIVSEDIKDAIDPNQISLLDQIADMEADMMDEDIRYAANEAEEIPFNLDDDDDTVLDALLVPIEREISPENSTDIFPQDETVEYTDPAGNTFEAIDELEVEELTLEQPEESILQYTDKDGNTFEAIEFHNAVVEPSSNSDFDLDFNETETEADNASDFF